jgi:8-oxo-dGTP pyrophosphatase MutT (NUDIX family)
VSVEELVSAGGVVYRSGSQGLEVVACGRTSDGVWGLPKGAPEPGEELEAAAMREVTEETGLRVEIEEKIGAIQYWFARPGVRYHKTVHHYLMAASGGSVDEHDFEYDRVEWLPVEEACRLLSYKNEVDMVRKAAGMLDSRESSGRGG